MKKKPENTSHGNEIKADSQEQVLTRRAAIKRLAKVVGGALVGAVVVGQVTPSWGGYYSQAMYSSTYYPPYTSIRYSSGR